MKSWSIFRLSILFLGLIMATSSLKAEKRLALSVPARAGHVQDYSGNSDQYAWHLLTYFAAPVPGTNPSKVLFETWATDGDIYTISPKWPDPNAPTVFTRRPTDNLGDSHESSHSIPCSPPPNAAVGRFPESGTPIPCIAEQVSRNRAEYDYIVGNGLNTQTGLSNAFASGFEVKFPKESISIKADWVPTATLLQWVPELNSLENVRLNYLTVVSAGVEYGLVGLHFASKQNPSWVWATFENQFNPGRCDTMGCYDSFGAKKPVILPRKNVANTQYGTCAKTTPVLAEMTKANLSPVWQSYCLKSTMVDYATADGTPQILGNSVIERIQQNGSIATQSCMTCHHYAAFGADGQVTANSLAMLAFQPVGRAIPGPLKNSTHYDLMWGLLNAPK